MATGTFGTTGTTSLVSINGWNPQTAIADIATIAANILRQEANFRTSIIPGALSPSGRLFLPGGRGIIQLHPGDYVGYDHNGWPVVVTKESIADGSSSWAHS